MMPGTAPFAPTAMPGNWLDGSSFSTSMRARLLKGMGHQQLNPFPFCGDICSGRDT